MLEPRSGDLFVEKKDFSTPVLSLVEAACLLFMYICETLLFYSQWKIPFCPNANYGATTGR
jgi:hypothetical protein